ncbi:NAD-dependent epimerase/dehydratase family protein [Demequina flava]|uniref:NAD-dependent epimerase/dehydratase family protein n=1 Tax=Demequina flava TaxID=1095025 RepID=UPI00078480E0|nr:NAD-dependent epimerase/dehydratase family protein [Demequina flava]
MRIVLAGASGVIGSRLIPLLQDGGHEVIGLTRTAAHVDGINAAGATGIQVDILDADAVRAVVSKHRPDLVMHQVTDLPDSKLALLFKVRALGRIRTIGTDNLVAAATAVDARVVAQSVAFSLPRQAQRAIDYLEAAVLGVHGQVVRYGQFYGPGTWAERAPSGPDVVHVDAAAQATARLIDEPGGVVEVRDSGITRP